MPRAAAKRLLDEEPRPEVSEPELEVPSRGVNLFDVVSLAVACGVADLDELVAEARRRAPGLEAGYPVLHPEPPKDSKSATALSSLVSDGNPLPG